MNKMHHIKKTSLVIGILIAVFFIGYLIISFREEIAIYLIQYKNFIRQYGIYAPIIYIGLFTLSAIFLFPPAGFSVYTFLSGLMFGLIPGVCYSLIGALLGTSIPFILTRKFTSHKLIKRLSTKFDKTITHINSKNWYLIAFLRLFPVIPLGFQNYLFGLTSIRYVTYILTTAIFLLPKIGVNNYIGSLGESFLLKQGIFLAQERIFVYGILLAILVILWLAFRKAKQHWSF